MTRCRQRSSCYACWRRRRQGRGLLRLLRGQGRHEAVQQGLAGRARARRRSHGHHDGQRLPRRSQGVRDGHPRADSIEREQIHVGDKAVLEHLDAFTAPRLVEYFDPDPCSVARRYAPARVGRRPGGRACAQRGDARAPRASASRSRPNTPWASTTSSSCRRREQRARDVAARQRLPHSGGRVERARQLHQAEDALLRGQGEPGGAGQARVRHLRPIQVAYESPKFMLPIRLGMVNAEGAQELFVYALTRQGPGRDDELPDGQAAHRRRDPGLT